MVTDQLSAPTVWALLAALADGDGDRSAHVERLTSALDGLAASGDDELAWIFAPEPGRPASVYRVEEYSLGEVQPHRVQVFDGAACAWETFRQARATSCELVAVNAEIRRTVATVGSGGEIHLPVPNSYRLDGAQVETAANRWSHLAEALGGGRRPRLPASRSPSAPPPSSANSPPAVQPTARIDAVAAAEALRARVVEGRPPADRRRDPTAVRGWPRSFVDGIGWAHVGLGAVAVFLAFLFVRFTVDDAFISWRYGLTFVHSGHWNWNRSGPTVEAYSNFLYTALSIVPAALRIPMELFFKAVAVGIVGGYIAWVRRLELPERQRLVLYAVALASPVFYVQLFSGLETVSFAILIAVLFAAIYRTGRLGPWGYLAAAAVAVSRPEGIAFALAAMAWVLVIDPRRSHWRGTAGVIGAYALYWVWRAQHFGWFWPNTFYVKSAHRGSIVHQVSSVMDGLLPAIAIGVLVVAAGRLLGRRAERSARRPRRDVLQDATPVVLAVLSALVVLFLYKQSDLGMDFANRFLWQLVFPVIAVALARPIGWVAGRHRPTREAKDVWALAAIGIAAMVAVAYNPGNVTSQIVVLAAVVTVAVAAIIRLASGQTAATMVAAIGLAVLVSWMPVNNMVGWAAYRYRLHYGHEAMGHVLAHSNIRGSIAIGDAGILPFELGQQVIDINGLADASIAHGTFSAADLRARHLGLVVALSSTPNPSGEWRVSVGQVVTYDYVRTEGGFWWSQGPEFAPGYWLNFWVDPKYAKPDLLQRLQAVTNRSVKETSKDDDTLLSDHLFDLPFLR